MKLKLSILAAMTGALLLGAPAAHGQPATKLTTNLSPATINAIWCSALFLEEAFYQDEDGSAYYEDMSYDLEVQLHDIMNEAGLRDVESDEIWTIFDYAAADLSLMDDEEFFQVLDDCETAYTDNKLKLR